MHKLYSYKTYGRPIPPVPLIYDPSSHFPSAPTYGAFPSSKIYFFFFEMLFTNASPIITTPTSAVMVFHQ
jgi:hypothetical protein